MQRTRKLAFAQTVRALVAAPISDLQARDKGEKPYTDYRSNFARTAANGGLSIILIAVYLSGNSNKEFLSQLHLSPCSLCLERNHALGGQAGGERLF